MARTELDLNNEPSPSDASGAAETSARGDGSKPSRRRRRHSRRVRIAVRIAIGVIIAWLASAAVITAIGLRDASHAMQDLQQAKSDLSASELTTTAPQAELRKAH